MIMQASNKYMKKIAESLETNKFTQTHAYNVLKNIFL